MRVGREIHDTVVRRPTERDDVGELSNPSTNE